MMVWALTAVVMASAGAKEVETTPKKVESERSSVFEFKLGSYYPLIDQEPGLTGTPYQSTFGGTGMLLGQLEAEWQFFQKLGSLAVGASVGYAEKFGDASFASGAASGQRTGLYVVPLQLLLIYRFDYLAERFHVPLVPYAKAALVGIPWWVVKGSGLDSFAGQKAQGFRFGAAGIFGLALQLDFLDPRLARDFDTSAGVNHSYLFAEFSLQEVNNFGRSGLNLSSRHLMFGLALEF